MASKENITIKVTVSQPALDNREGEVSQSMLISFGQWLKGDNAQADWNEKDTAAAGYIRHKPTFGGSGPVEINEEDGRVTVSLSASLLAQIYAVTNSFWLSPLAWDNQKQWIS